MMRRIFTSCNRQINQYSLTRCNPLLSSMRRMTNFRKHDPQYSLNLVQNSLFQNLNEDAFKSVPLLTFRDIVSYSRTLKLFDKMSDNDGSHLIETANYLRKNLATIIARNIIDFQNLPYGVGENPRIEQITQTYIDSYTAIKQFKNINSIQQKNEFHETLQKYIANWSQVPNLCLGLLEMAEKHSSNKIKECPYLSNFIDRIIIRRLAARVLLGHYIALHTHQWGIFEENCQVIQHIEAAKQDAIKKAHELYPADRIPTINISDMRKNEKPFVFSSKMVHQFCFELIKNSIRATIEANYSFTTTLPENDINIIVVNSNDGDITIKIADTGGGISRKEMQKIWLYSYTAARKKKSLFNERSGVNGQQHNGVDVNGSKSQIELLKKTANVNKKSFTHNPYYIGVTESDMISMYGLGYGLPLIKAYSQYFGGSCKIHSIDGYGTDSYLFLPTLDRSDSNILYVE